MVHAMELTYDQMVDSMVNAFNKIGYPNPQTQGDYIDYKGRKVSKGKLWPHDQRMKEIIKIVQFHPYWGKGKEYEFESDYPAIEIHLTNKMRRKKIFNDDGDCFAYIRKFMEENFTFLKSKNISDEDDWGEYKTEAEWNAYPLASKNLLLTIYPIPPHADCCTVGSEEVVARPRKLTINDDVAARADEALVAHTKIIFPKATIGACL